MVSVLGLQLDWPDQGQIRKIQIVEVAEWWARLQAVLYVIRRISGQLDDVVKPANVVPPQASGAPASTIKRIRPTDLDQI